MIGMGREVLIDKVRAKALEYPDDSEIFAFGGPLF